MFVMGVDFLISELRWGCLQLAVYGFFFSANHRSLTVALQKLGVIRCNCHNVLAFKEYLIETR